MEDALREILAISPPLNLPLPSDTLIRVLALLALSPVSLLQKIIHDREKQVNGYMDR